MKKLTAAQVLSEFVWNKENQLPLSIVSGSFEKGFDIDNNVLLPFLMKFQNYLHQKQAQP